MSKKSVKSFFVSLLTGLVMVLGILSGMFIAVMSTICAVSVCIHASEIIPLFVAGIITSTILIVLGAIIVGIGELRLSDGKYDFDGYGSFGKISHYIFKKRFGHVTFAIGLTLLLLLAMIGSKTPFSWPALMFFFALGITAFSVIETTIFSKFPTSEKQYVKSNTIFYVSIIILTILLFLTKSPIFN